MRSTRSQNGLIGNRSEEGRMSSIAMAVQISQDLLTSLFLAEWGLHVLWRHSHAPAAFRPKLQEDGSSRRLNIFFSVPDPFKHCSRGAKDSRPQFVFAFSMQLYAIAFYNWQESGRRTTTSINGVFQLTIWTQSRQYYLSRQR